MANYLPVALADSARSWLHGEYIRRFSEQRNKISSISDDVIIAAFTKGVRNDLLVSKFGRKPPRTVKQIFEKGNDFAKSDEAVLASKLSGINWKSKKDRPTTGVSGSGTNNKDRKTICSAICQTNQEADEQSTSKKKDDDDDGPPGFQDSRKELNHIFGGPEAYDSKGKQKLTDREINAVQSKTPQYLRWSEIAIKFDRSDHPDRVVHPGRYPLVLDPVVRNVKLRRSLVDGGSVLNILFAKTLDGLQIP
uniref:Retrotransposon protein, putative, Ty3-gypsy subclass n=2 Tax=Oryza sativa subsp. japonica TaxID=39947 RepID=Q53J50_ORYSJ|nr:retrotransposon protein, putative, Ty3-gypsy sub-class [Oryza sativa Japonica Group]ABA92963.1 retrotransposon protein, putative, Ty3-gypsy subclass [Oryza sativa Japonica Group]